MSSSEQVTLSGLGTYVLGRLFFKTEGFTPRQIAKTLSFLFRRREGQSDPTRLIENELIGFVQIGLAVRARRASYQITHDGQKAIRAALHLAHNKKVRWLEFKDLIAARIFEEHLSAVKGPRELAVDVPPAEAARIATLLVGAFHLNLGQVPSLPRVLGAVAWSAIGVTTADPFTVEAVMRVLLSRQADAPPQGTLKQAIDLLVRKASALGTGARGLLAPQTAPLPADEPAFAARVLEAARASKSGRFGDNKVFISHVVRRLAEDGVAIGDADTFKARLVSAHRRGLLALNRADLVEAMDPADVDASETRYLSTTFHFVRI
ncbi:MULTISPECIES: hypothetical protein [Sorangium]|uniref:Uncharacterized protein n=1 Tax=Sorangium cellulosum TaxID=56 RepID=A0A4P2QZ06_SORCE|nr:MULTISPECIES: hypothetical protein [Sorangium]AUX35536.1 uncharacterized protein SOCE836_077300 [Sorangium cellulosum]WCQ94837.1 hypothetical protein NQZ70_07608 [Sorangium sp. Soce836]